MRRGVSRSHTRDVNGLPPIRGNAKSRSWKNISSKRGSNESFPALPRPAPRGTMKYILRERLANMHARLVPFALFQKFAREMRVIARETAVNLPPYILRNSLLSQQLF